MFLVTLECPDGRHRLMDMHQKIPKIIKRRRTKKCAGYVRAAVKLIATLKYAASAIGWKATKMGISR